MLQILGKFIIFKDLQMIEKSLFDIFNHIKVRKNAPSLHLQVSPRTLWLGSPLRGDASPSGGAKEILVYQDPKKFQGGDAADADADADADGSTDGRQIWNSNVDDGKLSADSRALLPSLFYGALIKSGILFA